MAAVSYLANIALGGGYIITKCDKSLLQKASGCLLQNATVLLQITTIIIKCINFITKCDSYHKMRRLLQNVSVQSLSLLNRKKK